MVPGSAKSLRAVVAGVAALVLSFSLLRPTAELFAILIRRHWPQAWFSGLIVWYLDFFAAGLAIAIAIAIGRYSFRMEHQAESKADRVDRLLRVCTFAAVLIGVFQWAEGHYFRALVAAVTFLLVIPWLGKGWINRSDRRAGI
jgi:cation transport ATPase